MVASGDGHLPARVERLVDDLAGDLLLLLALVPLHVELHVVLESLDLPAGEGSKVHSMMHVCHATIHVLVHVCSCRSHAVLSGTLQP